MSRVIVFGSLNMDVSIACERMPEAGETLTGSGLSLSPGGKGANQAAAAARLGADTAMLGAVGDDAFGDDLLSSLAGAGAGCEGVARARGVATGTAVIIRTGGDNRIVIEPGANAWLRAPDAERAVTRLASPGDVFLTQLECDREATFAALAAARRAGAYTMFNPAPASPVPREVWESVDLVCLNETECAAITGVLPGDRASCEAAMEALSALGVGVAALTLGARGSIVEGGGRRIASVPPEVDAVDTTCAGDTYLGALAAARAAGLGLEDAVARATAASALATTRVGAQRSIPGPGEVDALLARGR